VASAVSKPDGLLVVEPDREQEFLLPLPVERLWGVGAVTAEKLHRYGIRTVGELAELEAATAERMLGRAAGAQLHALARLRDPRPVEPTRRRSSIGSQRALGRGPRTPDELDLILTQIVDRLGRRLRDGDRVCRTVVLRLRFGDFTRATPTEIASPTSALTRSRSRTATSSGVPTMWRRPPTSRNASSIESPSTSGVVSRKIANTSLLAAEYASIRGGTTTASGHSSRACRPPIAVRTPRAFAS
jgi:nucleotidyltransferase/DNA polymerase involved in DNA repair